MNKKTHKWQLFSSPRNGQVRIEACELCGVAKGMVHPDHKCRTSNEKSNRLKGWKKVVQTPQNVKALVSNVTHLAY